MSSHICLFTIPSPSRFTSPLFHVNSPKKAFTAMSVEGTGMENLDHLQRPNKQQSRQQPKRLLATVTPVGLWDRFPAARTVQQMMETMDRVFEDPFVYPGESSSSLSQTERSGYRRGRTPWDIKEAETAYIMRFDMPGMTKEDVKVWVEEKMLVVQAEKLSKNVEEGGEEWSAKSFGRYNSRIVLPENIQFEKIKAEVKDGVLYISIPKRVSNVSKVFDINVD